MQKLIVAHRGASKIEHENTLKAFQKAIDMGADMIETDVRKTKDGQLVVYHYQVLGNKLLRNCTYQQALELSRLAGYEIPTLEETLKLISGKIKLDLEFKESGYEKEVLDLVLKYIKPEDLVVTSFLNSVVLYAKRNYPQVKVGLLMEPFGTTFLNWFRYRDFSYFVESLVGRRQAVKLCDFFVPRRDIFESAELDNPRYGQKLCSIFTVDDEKEMLLLLKNPRVSSIITNLPDVALKVRNEIQ